ncbi:MAG TPA: GAF domain-containing sensor histidine kinase, partial [Candidatus Limnocylindria bacterium]|nr:GAF domain-containing sensor histidine kinase [Candidatus Limnocylindria bacterium]
VAIELAEANASWRAQRQGQELEGRLRAARELQRSLRQHDPNAVLDRATNQIAELFGADGVSVMLVDAEGRLAVRSARGLSDEAKRDRKVIGEGISGTVAKSGQPTILAGPVAGGSDATVSEAMIVPLRIGDRTLGVVNVKHRSPQQKYTQTQLDSLVLVAQDVASAYTTAEELRRAEDDRQQAIVLYELSRFATLGTDVQGDLGAAVAMLAGTLHHDAAAVWQHENDRLRLRAATGYDAPAESEIAVDEADTTLATVLREKHTHRVQIGVADERPEWAAPGCTHFVLAPIAGIGALVVGRATLPYTDAERDFATTVADYLVGMLQKSSAQDVVDRGIATERRRIAQEIHDGLAQELTGVVLALEGCQRAFEKDPALLSPQLAKASRDARATLADVRQYMAALRQSETGALNLPVTLARLVDDLRRQTGLQVEMDESGAQRELEPIVERAVIRIVGEALRNVAQHAGAQKAKVALLYGAEGVVVTVEDDGKGFDVEATFAKAEGSGHFGVVGMRERAEAAGGQLVVRSEAGRGTIVRASIPYANFAAVPGMTNGPIEDVERQPGIEDQDTAERSGFLGRLFGR